VNTNAPIFTLRFLLRVGGTPTKNATKPHAQERAITQAELCCAQLRVGQHDEFQPNFTASVARRAHPEPGW
jgi:hypothetical protein